MIKKFSAAVCLLVAFAGYAAEYRRISAEEAKKMLDENPSAILLDVRTEAEFMEKRIAGSILLPN